MDKGLTFAILNLRARLHRRRPSIAPRNAATRSNLVIRVALAALWSLIGTLMTGAAIAQTSSPTEELLKASVVLDAGIYILGTDVKANLNGSSVTNPELDFNTTFGTGSDATRVRIDGLWRITPRQHIDFTYFNDSITRSRTLDAEIHWGDNTFPVGADVTAVHKIVVYEVAYEYAFMRERNYEVAAVAGFHVSEISIGLSGNVTVTDPSTHSVSQSFQSSLNSVTAPLPVIGVRAGWAVSPHWFLEGGAQVFDASADGYNGFWTDLRAGTSWMFSRHMGVGLGYDYFSMNVQSNKASFDGRLKVGYSGLRLYLTGSF